MTQSVGAIFPSKQECQARTGDPQNRAPAPTAAQHLAAPVTETKTDTGWQDPAPAATPEPAPTPTPTAEASPSEENAGGAQDILAMIRARQGQVINNTPQA